THTRALRGLRADWLQSDRVDEHRRALRHRALLRRHVLLQPAAPMPDTVTLRAPGAVDARPPAEQEAYALEAALRSLVHIGAITSARSKQRAIGASQAG